MRGDVTMYSTRPLIGCDLARFGERGVGGKKLGRKRQVHTIIIICNTQCHLQWQCLREKIDHFKLFGWFKLSALENESYQTLRPESICWL